MSASASASPDSYDYSASPIHLAMVVTYDAQGVPLAYYEIRDESALKELESFFPGYRTFARFDSNEWKTTLYRIHLCLYAGRAIKIISDGARWGVTFGGAPVNGDLAAFLRRFAPSLAKAATAGLIK